jgi:hypothetical protein
MTVYHHPIYRDLIHNEDATNQNNGEGASTCTPQKYYLGNEINTYDIRKACGIHRRQMYTGSWLENLTERDHLHRVPF